MKTKELSFWCLQKSAQECEKKGDRPKNIGRLEGLKVGMLKEKEVESSKLKVESEERMEREWRGLLRWWWSRTFTTHDNVNYIICQLQH